MLKKIWNIVISLFQKRREVVACEALPREMARVRDKVMPIYLTLGPAANPALFLMRAELDAAAKALASGDLVAMIRCYESLKGFSV